MRTLVLGGIKSGKSQLAEKIAVDTGKRVALIATATGDDDEMRQRIARHRQSRPADWLVIEEPIALAAALKKYGAPDTCVIIDCLTLWLTNLLLRDDNRLLSNETLALTDSFSGFTGDLIVVSNETSMGIVPMGELTRRFCDEAGLLHQRLAQCCDNVYLTVAGIPMVLKGSLKND